MKGSGDDGGTMGGMVEPTFTLLYRCYGYVREGAISNRIPSKHHRAIRTPSAPRCVLIIDKEASTPTGELPRFSYIVCEIFCQDIFFHILS